ncbi:meiotic recombination protein REC8 homolog [Lates japonicus]|uniref:Meiotic recombination protein REC8 homolog n=1 Tax=Lates japonicus TaxID=270547 RepID=A0AAD3R4R6_LATJO|nr:meiotic recombination protein REC8 homolog [Lates japonicus]
MLKSEWLTGILPAAGEHRRLMVLGSHMRATDIAGSVKTSGRLAATRGIRVTRRELLKVNVKRTCGDILNYVTAQVPPLQPNLPRPKFSLYLSSQLQYGVVVVYHRQCGFLLEEVQQTIDRLLRAKRCTPIDMDESDRLALNVPDNLHMMEEAEGAQDPFFGLMESQQLLSPYKIHPAVFVIEEVGSQHSLVPSPLITSDKEGFRSPPAAITLTERDQIAITATECFEGDDLPEATAREIDLLMDQPDQFCREVEEQRTRERTRELEGAMSSIDQLRETVLGAEQDSVWLLDEELGQPVEVPLAAVALEMTPLQVQPDLAHQPFPFLDTTLADLGIQEVKEVVWVDTKKAYE